ncbi:MAG: metal ABC transporter ATP-binding protein [Anaerolineaceae bacterium]|nr:MAG: metal ABC transporter ATP-binding protein [Anaerolineaceae bacterium]
MKEKPIISIRNLWAGYDSQPVLEDINLDVMQGDFIGLIGPNGGGKTTLLKVVMGLIEPHKGIISVMGKDPKQGRCHIGYVPQQVALDRDFPISVWDVVKMGRLGCRGMLQRTSKDDEDIIIDSLQQVDIHNLRTRAIGDLSVGQRQRVYIARALATRPLILLMDEPTASVDPQASKNIYELLHELNKEITIVMVSHNMDAVSSHVKSIGCINRRLYYHGTTEITEEMVNAIYNCPIDLIAHGVPHRVLSPHTHEKEDHA